MSLEESKRPIDQGDLKRLKVIRGGNHAKVTKIQHEALDLLQSYRMESSLRPSKEEFIQQLMVLLKTLKEKESYFAKIG